MKKIIVASACFLSFASAFSEELKSNGFSYDYIEGNYQTGTVKDTSDGSTFSADVTGYQANISKLLTNNIFVSATLGSASADSIKVDSTSYAIKTDVKLNGIGLGYRVPVNEKTDFNVFVGALSGTTSASGLGVSISESKTRYPVTVSLRFNVSDGVELQTSYGRMSGENSFMVGGGFELTKGIALIAAYDSSKTSSATIVGLRFNF